MGFSLLGGRGSARVSIRHSVHLLGFIVFMPTLLVVHLVVVLALFITFPYGKFVHGIYRAAALLKFRRECA